MRKQKIVASIVSLIEIFSFFPGKGACGYLEVIKKEDIKKEKSVQRKEEARNVIKFKDAPFKQVIDYLSEKYKFGYVIRYPDFNFGKGEDVKEILIKSGSGNFSLSSVPGLGVGSSSGLVAGGIPGLVVNNGSVVNSPGNPLVMPFHSGSVVVGGVGGRLGGGLSGGLYGPSVGFSVGASGFSPGAGFLDRLISFVFVDGDDARKVVESFCQVSDVNCSWEGEVLVIEPYILKQFDVSIFFDFDLSNSVGLESIGSSSGTGISGGVGISGMIGGMSFPSSSSSSLGGTNTFKIADRMEDFVEKLLSGLKSSEGRVFLSKRGYVIVIDRPSVVKRIAEVIEKERQKQTPVYLNVKVIRVDLNTKRQAGIDWDAVIKKIFGGDSQSISFSGKFSPSEGMSFVFSSNKVNLLLKVLEEFGDVKIEHDWVTKARSGIPVVFADIKSIPYIVESQVMNQQGTTQTARSPSFVDVGIKITVDGSINTNVKDKDDLHYEGHVFISISDLIELKNLGTEDSPYFLPYVKGSSIAIPVSLKFGESIVISSFKTDQNKQTSKGLPGLSRIPVLGSLFGYQSKEKEISEFVVILTPQKI